MSKDELLQLDLFGDDQDKQKNDPPGKTDRAASFKPYDEEHCKMLRIMSEQLKQNNYGI